MGWRVGRWGRGGSGIVGNWEVEEVEWGGEQERGRTGSKMMGVVRRKTIEKLIRGKEGGGS